jgi:hypothetical protein
MLCRRNKLRKTRAARGFYLRGLARAIVVDRSWPHDAVRAMVTALGITAAAIMWSRRRRKKERFISIIRVEDDDEYYENSMCATPISRNSCVEVLRRECGDGLSKARKLFLAKFWTIAANNSERMSTWRSRSYALVRARAQKSESVQKANSALGACRRAVGGHIAPMELLCDLCHCPRALRSKGTSFMGHTGIAPTPDEPQPNTNKETDAKWKHFKIASNDPTARTTQCLGSKL